ncbi:MAG: ATP synthase F1 subunit gamma [Candidatus Daviesbacteria bacterium]|nr:ATP synthase F1 subunit gamma [Candidatus Daviesbacteria bacterium]
MASSRELRRRIKSIKNTAQITKAMQMVAATKMRKAQNQAISARPYIATLSFALMQVCDKLDPALSPILKVPETGKTVVVTLSSDKGLCGALNTNLFRLITSNNDLNNKDTVFLTRGKKARDFLVRTGKNLEADFENAEHIDFASAVEIRKYVLNGLLSGEIKEVYLLYTDFITTLRQEPRLLKVLPFDSVSILEQCKVYAENAPSLNVEFMFEPDPIKVMEYALIHLLDTQIYQALLETKASEHSARMIAMQNATENAKELVTDLTLSYNQARQGAITRELLEIASAGAALEAA